MKRVLLLTAVLMLIAAVAFRWWLPAERSAAPTITLPETRLDYRLTDYQARFFDESGALELEITGPDLTHDAESRVVSLSTPEFRFQGDAQPWWGQARAGRFERGMETLALIGQVELWQELPQGRLTLTSERLQHDRPARTISADVPVILTRPGTELNAGGLRIQLDTERVELSDDVYIVQNAISNDD